MNTIYTIAKLTFREALRRKIVLAALLLGIAFLSLYSIGFHYIYQDLQHRSTRMPQEMMQSQAINLLLMAGMYVVNFLCIAIAALITSDSLAGEIQSGTIQSLVTKPVRRMDVVLGKWMGHATLLLLYVMLMAGGVIISLWAQAGYLPPNGLAGIALIYANSLIIMTLTLAFSSTLSTLATGGAVFGAFGLAFIGGWVERIGSILQNQTAVNLGIVSSLLLPSEAIWNKSSSLMASSLMNLVGATPFSTGSEPSNAMMAYAGVYLLVMLFIAIRQFGKRDL